MAVKVITYDVGTTGMKACLFDISAEESVKFIAGETDGYELHVMMYACSGGTTQMAVEKIVKEIGTDIMLAAGGGVHGHPDGSEAGAKSMRQAIDAAMKDIPVTEYAKDHPELARMLAFLNPDLKKNFDLMQ